MVSVPYLLLAVQRYVPAWWRSATRCSCELSPARTPQGSAGARPAGCGVSSTWLGDGGLPSGVAQAMLSGASPDAVQSNTTDCPAAPLTLTARVRKCAGTEDTMTLT